MKQYAFQDQVVIVTGASAGIGKSLALLLASQCAKVVIAARRRDRLEQIAEQCRMFCGDVLVVPTDVSDEVRLETGKDRTGLLYALTSFSANVTSGVPLRGAALEPAVILMVSWGAAAFIR